MTVNVYTEPIKRKNGDCYDWDVYINDEEYIGKLIAVYNAGDSVAWQFKPNWPSAKIKHSDFRILFRCSLEAYAEYNGLEIPTVKYVGNFEHHGLKAPKKTRNRKKNAT